MDNQQTITEKLNNIQKEAEGIVFPYSEEYSESHHEFAQRMWPNKIRRREEDYIRWKFRGNKQGNLDGFLLAVIDNQVVGQLGLIPVKVRINKKEYSAQWACDLMVDPSCRLKGLGSLLLAYGMCRDMVTLGSDPSPLADITMSRLGFVPLLGPWKMVLPLRVNHVLSWKVSSRWRELINLVSKMLQPIWNKRLDLLGSKQFEEIQSGTLEEISQLIYNKQKSMSNPYIIHDMEFLEWRFRVFNTPLRTMITGNGGYAIYEATPNFFYVYDWGYKDQEDANSLLINLLRIARYSESRTIMVYANNPEEKAFLLGLGYMKMRTPTKIIIFPQKVIPENEPNFHYCIYDSDGNL